MTLVSVLGRLEEILETASNCVWGREEIYVFSMQSDGPRIGLIMMAIDKRH